MYKSKLETNEVNRAVGSFYESKLNRLDKIYDTLGKIAIGGMLIYGVATSTLNLDNKTKNNLTGALGASMVEISLLMGLTLNERRRINKKQNKNIENILEDVPMHI